MKLSNNLIAILSLLLFQWVPVMAADETSTNHKLPATIILLSKADKFYGPTPGETGATPVQKAYLEATGNVGSLETEDLNWLLKKGSPAGRIYAAVLFWQTGRVGTNKSFALLTSDNSAVEYQDGCKVMGSKVSEIAKSLIDSQKFMNFQLGSMFCKMKSPVDPN